MSQKKIIAVVGATGAQGGGLVRAILSDRDGTFRARALTRNTQSEKAAALADLGAEVVAADLEDYESVRRAFEGAYGAFCLTNFWEHFSPEKELEQAKRMANAAQATGLKHVVWSTLENTRNWIPLDDDRMPTLMEKYKVPHFDAKGEADQAFQDCGVPTTFLLTSFYWDNFIHFGMGPKRGADGRLYVSFPMGEKKLPGIAAEDIGKCALGILKDPAHIGSTIGIAGEHLTGAELAAAFTEALGEDVRYHAVSFDTYRSFDFPGAADLGNMFQFKHDFNDYFCRIRDIDKSRALNPALQTFAQWLSAHRDEIRFD